MLYRHTSTDTTFKSKLDAVSFIVSTGIMMDLRKRKVFLILLGACGAVLIWMGIFMDFTSHHQVLLVAANFHNTSLSYLTALNLSVNILPNKKQELKSSLVRGNRKYFQNLDGNSKITDTNVTENDLRYVRVNNRSGAPNQSETENSSELKTDFILRQSKKNGGNSKTSEPFSQNKLVSRNTNASDSNIERRKTLSNSVMFGNYGYKKRFRSKPAVVQENSVLEHDNIAAPDDVIEDIHNDPDTLFDATKIKRQGEALNFQKPLKKPDILNYIKSVEINKEVRYKGNDKVNKNNDVNLRTEVNDLKVKDGGSDRLRNSEKTFQSTDDSTETIIQLENQYRGEHESSIGAVENRNGISQSISVGRTAYPQPVDTFEHNSSVNSFKNKTSYSNIYDNGKVHTQEGFAQDPTCKSRFTGVEDILCMRRPDFLPDFRNPCWYQRSTLKCLPYFQIIGVCKTGTTDLFERLSHHPQIIKNNGILGKETWYWTWRRYGHSHFHREYANQMSLADFIDMFDARSVESYTKRQSDGTSYHPAVTGHGDPMDFWDQSSWKMIPQNDPSTDVPEVTTPSLIKHVNPNIKLILLLRDPVERLFSNYLHAQFGRTSAEFHDDVMASLSLLTSCTRNRTMKACLYDEGIIRTLQVPISGSFYSIHLQEWLKVFPRKQIYITRTEDFSKSVADTLLGIFRFLNLDPLPTRDLYRIANMPHYYDTKAKQTSGEILDETRAALRSLFQPYNSDLAKMLNDRKYEFSDTGR